MTLSELERLAREAQEAARGAWQEGIAGTADVVRFDGDDIKPVAVTFGPEVCRWIAACDPAAILALIERCRAMERQMQQAKMALNVIAEGSPMPPEWGEQARGVDAYHRAVATSTLDALLALDAREGKEGE